MAVDFTLKVCVRDYIELTKPSLTWLILLSTGIGYFFGLESAPTWLQFLRSIDYPSLLHTILGTALIASGAAALNQWLEREADRKMRRMPRTLARPLPAGRLSAPRALAFGAVLCVAGFLELWLGVNLLSALIGAFTLISYLYIYTPMKQRTWWSTTVGAFPGSCVVYDGETACLDASGKAEIRLMLFPATAYEVQDTWQVGGLRGTGSHNFSISDQFVPADRSLIAFAGQAAQPAILYKFPFSLFAARIAAVPLGIARGADSARKMREAV